MTDSDPPTDEMLRARLIETMSLQPGASDHDPASARDAGTVIDRSISGNGDAAWPEIDGYRLERTLGRGGMGAVFAGVQLSTDRRVAIKFMLDAFGASAAARQRFEREVAVVARLQHPSIVSVIDSGVRSGRYFYVMEFVEGRTLDAALNPGTASIEQVIDLMVKICEAIDYAHQHGVLHRDLKPANILVDAQGAPHLLDFGLAKIVDEAGESEEPHGRLGLTVSGPGQLLGTVAYMSPEQAGGRHDQTSVRTDVFALGVIFYELLTGRLPASLESSLQDVLRRITEEDAIAPSQFRKGVSRDCDAVVLRALEKSPERRYSTAGEFAADLRRLRAGEPVVARHVGPAGRAWRWVGRNRAISTVTAVALMTLFIVSTLLILRIVRAYEVAQAERDLAQANFNRLRLILESADPDRSPGGVTVLQLLDAATRGLNESPPEDPRAEAEIRQVLGSVYRKLGGYAEAIGHQRRVLELREAQVRGRPDAALAEALHALAAALWWDGSYADAEELYERSLEIRRRLHPGDHPSVAFSLTHLAACSLRLGRLDRAQSMYEEALAMRRRMYGSEHDEIAQSLNNLAKCLLEAGDFVTAEELHREAFEMIRRLRGDRFLGTAAASQNLGECLLRRSIAEEVAGRMAESRRATLGAVEAYELALDIRARTFPEGHHLVAASKSGLARAKLRAGDVARAGELAQSAIELFARTRRDDHPDQIMAMTALGLVRAAEGASAEAIKLFEAALAIAREVRPPDEIAIAMHSVELGRIRAKSGDVEGGAALLGAAVARLRDLRGPDAAETREAEWSLTRAFRPADATDR